MHDIQLKINHLVNLHDARCCAAWGVNFVSFALEKGALHRLPEGMMQEIAGWLSGINVVLEYGADLATAHELPKLETPTYIQLDAEVLNAQPQIYSVPVIRTLHLPAQLPVDFWQWYHTLTQGAAIVEIIAANTIPLKEWTATLSLLCQQPIPTLFNLDYLPLHFFIDNDLRPFGFSARESVSLDFANLDYDACENLLSAIQNY